MKDADCWSGIALIVFALAGLCSASNIVQLKTQGLSAGFFPNLLFGVLILCGLILICQSWRRQEIIPFPKFQWRKLVPWFITLMMYALVFEYAGFIISTLIFMVVGMLLLGERRLVVLGAIPLLSTFGIYYLFSKIFMIVMP